jgi:hypothetical protein
MDTKLKKSTSFHPQTDGQTKVVNRTVVHLFRGYCSKHPKIWDEHLHYIQHSYNQAKHSSMQTSPFEACFGYLPKSPLDFIFGKDIAIDGQYDIDRVENVGYVLYSLHGLEGGPLGPPSGGARGQSPPRGGSGAAPPKKIFGPTYFRRADIFPGRHISRTT